jgi:Rps23 Pro-64 3,4-dihydroxylase Tpa1-like proline 4-hydroxylase
VSAPDATAADDWTIAMADHHDTGAYAARFAAAGRLHIPNFLQPDDAHRLHEAVVRRVRWSRLLIHDGPKIMSGPDWARLSAEERRKIDAEVAAAARVRFEGRFWNLDLTDTGAPYQGDPPELVALSIFLNSEPFLAFARAVTGLAAIDMADAQATLYRAGDFLHPHTDTDDTPGKNRLCAYVLSLTPNWNMEWGGLLCFAGEGGHVAECYTPAWNALNLLKVPQNHFVSSVAGFVDAGRYSVTGWLRRRQ